MTQETDIGILKSIWRKDESDIWTAHDMQGIYLKPRKGFEKDYFKIEPEIGLLTQRPGGVFDNLFATFGIADFLVGQSIVPIVAWNDGDAEMRCIGTGFFISASGLLRIYGNVLHFCISNRYIKSARRDIPGALRRSSSGWRSGSGCRRDLLIG